MNDWEWMKQEALINKHKSAALAAWTWAQCYCEGNIRRQGPQSPKLSLSDWVNALYIITIQKRTSSEALWTADTLHVSLMTARERGNVHFVTSTKKCIFLLFIVLFSLSRSAIEAHKHTKLQKKKYKRSLLPLFPQQATQIQSTCHVCCMNGAGRDMSRRFIPSGFFLNS